MKSLGIVEESRICHQIDHWRENEIREELTHLRLIIQYSTSQEKEFPTWKRFPQVTVKFLRGDGKTGADLRNYSQQQNLKKPL